MDDYQTAREYALQRLNRRECSSRDIEQRLVRKGISKDTVKKVVTELEEASLLSDARFSKMMIREQAARGKGPLVIRQKLKQNGIDLSVEQIKAISAEYGESKELEVARQMVARKYPNFATDKATMNRALQALLRRGFSFSDAKKLLS